MLHCCQTVNTRNTRRFSALYSKSESDISDYHSAEEKSPNRTEDHLQPEALTPKENEFDLLTSSTIIKGVEPLQPQPENRPNPFQRLLSEILIRNSKQTHWLEPKTETKMATDDKNGFVKLNLPKAFDGNWDKFRKFLQTAEIYLGINKKVYDDDLKKIGFILSFMTEGQAEAWADQFVEEAQTQNPGPNLDLRTYEEFVKTLKVTFSAYNSPGDALNEMKNVCMRYDDNIDKHIMTFATLLSESRLDKKSAVIVNIFRETLPVKLQSKILNSKPHLLT